MKIIMEIGQGLNGKLMLLDTLTMEWRTLKLRKDPQCPVCATSTTRI
jgi:adenylyltransferase/sulfurtransferase